MKLINYILLFVIFFSCLIFSQSTENKGEFIINGFISATFFAQDQSFILGSGQAAVFPLPPEYSKDRWFLDGDIRNTRISAKYTGYKISESWKLSSAVEVDFFGGSTNSNFVSDEQPVIRLRSAYVDIIKDQLTIRLGQFWAPFSSYTINSLSHIAYPLSSAAPAWRFPGIFIYYSFSDKESPTKANLQLALMRGSWEGPGNNLSSLSAGNASMLPQIEFKLNLDGKFTDGSWGTYIAGHYDKKDTSGVNDKGNSNSGYDGIAGEAGAKISYKFLSFTCNYFYGKAISQYFAHITQFGDIAGYGLWGQIGVNFLSNWSLWGFYGIDNPIDGDVYKFLGNQSKLKSENIAFMLMYKIQSFSIGVEWLRAKLITGFNKNEIIGNQVSLSTRFDF